MNFMKKIITFATGESTDINESANKVLAEFYKMAAIIFPVVCSVAAILVIIKLVLLGMKLAQSGDDPEERSRIIKGMIWWGIGLLVIIAAIAISATIFGVLQPGA